MAREEIVNGSMINLGYDGEIGSTNIVFVAPDDWVINNNVTILFEMPGMKEAIAIEPTKIEGQRIELLVDERLTKAGLGCMQFVLTEPNTDFIAVFNHLKQVDPSSLIIKSRIYDTICKSSIILDEEEGEQCLKRN